MVISFDNERRMISSRLSWPIPVEPAILAEVLEAPSEGSGIVLLVSREREGSDFFARFHGNSGTFVGHPAHRKAVYALFDTLFLVR
jgi:hypothetical protein